MTERPRGWFTDEEGEAYAKLVRGLSKAKIAEVGVFLGRSMSWIFEPCRENGNVIWAVDNWLGAGSVRGPKLQEGFLDTRDKWDARDFVSIASGDSSEVAGTFDDDYFDLVMIDGAHDYEGVKRDLKAWMPKVKSGGVLCGHDYCPKFHPAVIKAVDELVGDLDGLAHRFWWKVMA